MQYPGICSQALPGGLPPTTPPQTFPTGAQKASDWVHPPSGTQVCPTAHPALVSQMRTLVLGEQVFTIRQGPKAAQAASWKQSSGISDRTWGNTCRPRPIPADCGSIMNPRSAVFTASHLLAPDWVGSSIEYDASSIR